MMREMTDSAVFDTLKDVLSSKKYTDIIDALRPNSTYTLDVLENPL